MKIYVDADILNVECFKAFGEVALYRDASELGVETSKDNESKAIICRTTTHIDEEWLQKNAVKKLNFIATATAGFDHIDVEALEKRKIDFYSSPGCNSLSVKEFILTALSFYYNKLETLRKQRIFVCGAGNVGSKVVKALRRLGCEVMVCDLPLEDRGDVEESFVSMEAAKECDVLIFCVPLNREGKYQTKYFLNEDFFKGLKKKPLFVNTSRGQIVKTEVLSWAKDFGCVRDLILDVYENETSLKGQQLDLMKRCFISTPHIAGYSWESKDNASRMIYEQLQKRYGETKKYSSTIGGDGSVFMGSLPQENEDGLDIYKSMFSLKSISDAFKKEIGAQTLDEAMRIFSSLRPKFHHRRNFLFHTQETEVIKKYFENKVEVILNDILEYA